MTRVDLPPAGLHKMLELYDAGLDHCDYCDAWKPANPMLEHERAPRGGPGAQQDGADGWAGQSPKPAKGKHVVPAPLLAGINEAHAALKAGTLTGSPEIVARRKRWRSITEAEVVAHKKRQRPPKDRKWSPKR